MGRKTKIAIATGVALLALGAVGAYAYDSSQGDKIAEGVTIGGVDVGGMDEAEAKQAVRRQLLAPLQHSLRVGYDGESWTLPGKRLKVHADLDRAVEEALDASQDGDCPAASSATSPAARSRSRSRRRSPTPRPRSTASSAMSPSRSAANRRTRRSKHPAPR